MHRTDQNRIVGSLLRDYRRRGVISRRDLLRGAAGVGLSGMAFVALARATALRAFAQDATSATVALGSTLVAPQGLRTDLSGQAIKAVLSNSTDPDLPWVEAALANFTEVTGITAELIQGEQTADARLQAYRQQFAAQSSDNDVYQIDVIWPGIVAEHAVDLGRAAGRSRGAALRSDRCEQHGQRCSGRHPVVHRRRSALLAAGPRRLVRRGRTGDLGRSRDRRADRHGRRARRR